MAKHNENELIKPLYRSAVKIAAEGLLRSMKYVAPKYAKGRLIDSGCGIKPYEAIFAPHVEQYYGIDYMPTAESNYGDQTRADLYVDCTATGLADDSFDTLLSTQVLEHIYDTKKYIAECYRLLRKGGVGIFTIPMSWRCHAEPYDYYRFTKYSLNKLFTDKGFTIVELREIEGSFATILQLFIIYLCNWRCKNIFKRIFRKIVCLLALPIINILALKMDEHLWDESLCLNYLLVVKKQ